MPIQELITTSPDILGGTSVFVGTRVPVKTLTDYLEAGETLDEFLLDFPSVSPKQAIGFLKYHQNQRLLEAINNAVNGESDTDQSAVSARRQHHQRMLTENEMY